MMNGKIFIEKLHLVADEVQKAGNKKLLHFDLAPPAPPALVEEVREKHFSGRDNALLDVYRQCNGFQLIWDRVEKDPPDVDFHPMIFRKRNLKFEGVINFLPLEIAFDEAQWKDVVWFDNDSERALEFGGINSTNRIIKKSLFPVDFFSVDMSVACFNGKDNCYMVLLQDYHIGYTDSMLVLCEDYLSFLLETQGLVSARYKVLNQLDGYRQPALGIDGLLQRINQ
jgi:hypothetical protein